MPAAAPPVSTDVAAELKGLGQRLRGHRKQLGVSAVTAAEAAGISRVTLHRIERGEPSVAMGSYWSAAMATGLTLRLVDPRSPAGRDAAADLEAAATLPARIALADYPQLRRLAWQRADDAEIEPHEAFALYERNWRHLDRPALTPREQTLLEALSARWGEGRFLV